ncbi:hypothetical protein PLIP_a2249 [Pseudoalteromonas lipolytica LMEB 39]|nr:hypothetical protein [Pseudoalteromonas lipolytica LMEB 39]
MKCFHGFRQKKCHLHDTLQLKGQGDCAQAVCYEQVSMALADW